MLTTCHRGPDAGQASSGTFHVTFLPLQPSQDEGLLPVALEDEKQAPGVMRGPLGTPASPGQGSQLRFPQDPELLELDGRGEGQGGGYLRCHFDAQPAATEHHQKAQRR